MRLRFAAILLLVAGVCQANAAWAGDVEDIERATAEHFATLNARNPSAHVAHHLPGHSTFDADGGLLQVDASLEAEAQALQEQFDRGLELDLQLRHVDVQVYGNTAVVTGYVVGTAIDTDGEPQRVMDRRTAVLVKRDNIWREVHIHSSPVVSAALE